ncbi:MAG: hypothetical protein IPL79_06915 [Myxococcales bacterium]|nr:hypothetical protein [Myxococcales bacterium]
MSASLVALGMAIGVSHAFEPDHLAAVSTMVTNEKRPWRALGLGMSWGLGHAAALFAVMVAIWVFGWHAPAALEGWLEGAVGVMLIALGVGNVLRARRAMAAGPRFEHAHGRRRHAHTGEQGHVHVGAMALASRSLMIGMLHGLAGSGGLAVLVATKASTPGGALAYASAFGVGAMVSMGVATMLVCFGLDRLAAWRAPLGRATIALSGAIAIAIGSWWTYRAVM